MTVSSIRSKLTERIRRNSYLFVLLLASTVFILLTIVVLSSALSRKGHALIMRAFREPQRPQLSFYKVNPYVYRNIVNNPDKCEGPVQVLLAVMTDADHFTQRAHIRWTYGKETSLLKTAFFFGRKNDTILDLNFVEENKAHKDIVQGDYDEHLQATYKVLKLMQILKWTKQFCSNTKFVLITDDTYYLDAENVMKFARNVDFEKAMLIGHYRSTDDIDRDHQGKAYISAPPLLYPNHIRGPTLVTKGAVEPLVKYMEYLKVNTDSTDTFPEIFLGNLAANLTIAFLHEDTFLGENEGIKVSTISSPGFGQIDDLLLEWRKRHLTNRRRSSSK